MASEFEHIVRRAELLDGPKNITLQATEEQCRALADRFDLVAVKRFVSNVHVEADGDDIVVSGRIDADVVQSCVTTLADVPGHVSDEFMIRFIPAEEMEEGDDEALIDMESAEDIEPLAGDGVDIGEAAAQSLSLALDPYPHAEGVEWVGAAKADGASEKGEEAEENPFAVLKKLYEKG